MFHSMLLTAFRSKEFQEIPLRRGERTTLNALNKDKHKATIRFQLEGKVKADSLV